MKAVLLVDDSPTMLASLAGILTRSGIAVEKACNGQEALGKLKPSPALRLIITDFHMPGMNGVELIREVRKMAAYRFLPILMLTTESDQGKRDLARAAGATGWLVKPVEPDKLLAVLQQVAPG
jgi:two-component system chemotaxis response regulator CheY